MTVRRIILLGAPGAGKGTQALQVAAELNIPHISTGDLLRAARTSETEIGKAAAAHMGTSGQLVPDDIVLSLIEERLSRPDVEGGYILDGFPRNKAQAEALAERGVTIDLVVSLEVPEETLKVRLAGRRMCRGCGASFHVDSSPTEVEGVCDRCGCETYQRADDAADVVTKRLVVHAEQTAPLSAWYENQGLLCAVDGVGPPDVVCHRIRRALGII